MKKNKTLSDILNRVALVVFVVFAVVVMLTFDRIVISIFAGAFLFFTIFFLSVYVMIIADELKIKNNEKRKRDSRTQRGE